MRQIKFRAWRKPSKEMTINIWPMVSQFESEDTEHVFMQFTGLLDKNGREIFENDIVKFTAKEDEGGGSYSHWSGVGKIGYSNDWGWRMELRDGTQRTANMMMQDVTRIEVIGNVFESPELLK